MGSGGSKAAGRSLAQAQKAAAAASVPSESIQHAINKDLNRQTQRVNVDDLDRKDDSLDGMLTKLSGAIRDQHSTPQPVYAAAAPAHDSPAAPHVAGGLPSPALREMLEEQGALRPRGQQVDIAKYAARYKTDPQVLQQVLEHCCLPQIYQTASTEGVTAVAEWPQWFQRSREG